MRLKKRIVKDKNWELYVKIGLRKKHSDKNGKELDCLTSPESMSQMVATRKAVGQIGLNQREKVKKEWFADLAQGEMFRKRLASLLAASTTKPATS